VPEKTKILFLGDSVSGNTGLGRIHRELALKTQEHLSDVLEVATLGGGTPPSDSIPLRQYPMGSIKDWIPSGLPYAWHKHVGDKDGILMCIWDVSRLLWMVYPEQCPDLTIRDFMQNFKGKKWLYPAIDGCGPNGKMPAILSDAMAKFDRVVNYTEFSSKITGYPNVCTHGIDTSIFYPRTDARAMVNAKFGLNLDLDEVLIGIVATNQPRKDWALAFGALALLNQQGIKARVWIHTDTDMRHWDLKAMYVDFGLHPGIKVFLTPYGLPDDDLATLYSACDCTIGPGVEGFGYPAAESLCCGTPHITGSYGGQADFVPTRFQINPIAYRYEGIFAIQRPVYDSGELAFAVLRAIKDKETSDSVCSWGEVWPKWKSWIEAGM
jgi:glycosyltransferase involved in cell wall biosynthesis